MKTVLVCMGVFLLAGCSSAPSGNSDGGVGGGGGSGGITQTGASGSSMESELELAGNAFCSTQCACYGCSKGMGECLEEFAEPTKKGEACDNLLAKQLTCAESTMKNCPADWSFDVDMVKCAPPMEEQEAACGPGGIPG